MSRLKFFSAAFVTRTSTQLSMNGITPFTPVYQVTKSLGASRGSATELSKFKEGDLTAVGCMVNSCRTCTNCQAGYEQYCLSGASGL